MKKKEIVIYGKGEFAELMYHFFSNDFKYEVKAFCVDKEFLIENEFCGLPLVSIDNVDKLYPSNKYFGFVAVGYSNMRNREIMFNKLKDKNYTLVNYISPKALIDKSVSIGENNVFLPFCNIEPFVKINNNNIFWSGVNICHHSMILSHNFIAAKTVVGGNVKIKNMCFIGFSSTIIENLIIDNKSFIGASSLILKNTDELGRYIGSPAVLVSSKEGIV